MTTSPRWSVQLRAIMRKEVSHTVQPSRRRWLSRDELVHRLRRAQSDPGLRQDLDALVGETTDELGPVQ